MHNNTKAASVTSGENSKRGPVIIEERSAEKRSSRKLHLELPEELDLTRAAAGVAAHVAKVAVRRVSTG